MSADDPTSPSVGDPPPFTAEGAQRSWGRGRVPPPLDQHALFGAGSVALPLGGPLYLRLKRWIEATIASGGLGTGDALPSERDLAKRLDLSRVTVRKAVQELVRDGVLVQRHGSGTFVAPPPQRVEQSLSRLTSFAEDMARRGMPVTTLWLERALHLPTPEESGALGLPPGSRVARIARLRLSGERPLAIERAALSSGILPDPQAVGTSLYAHLQAHGHRPVRAVQRIRAIGVGEADALLLELPAGVAVLQIERTSFAASGAALEFTRSIYRGDTYDFVAELNLGDQHGDLHK